MKTAIVLEGGGLANAFTCGMLYKWLEAGLRADGVVAVSTAFIPAAYYRAGQSEALENLFDEIFNQGDFSPVNRALRALSVGRMEAAVSVQLPVDMDAFNAAAEPLYAVYTRADNGDAVCREVSGCGEWRRLRHFAEAAVALPVETEPVPLDERSYFDGAIAESLPVRTALQEGFEKLLVVRTLPIGTAEGRKHLGAREHIALRGYPALKNVWQLSHLYRHQAEQTLERMIFSGRAMVLRPANDSRAAYGFTRSAAAEYYLEGLRLADETMEQVARFLEA